MDKATANLLQEIARSLGTTAGHLWGILLRQARYTAITDLLFLLIVVGLWIAFYRVHKWLKAETFGGYRGQPGDSSGYDYYDSAELAMGIVAVVLGLVTLGAVCCALPDCVLGFFAPDVWAVEHLLDKIKG